jgi:hypothetical protein
MSSRTDRVFTRIILFFKLAPRLLDPIQPASGLGWLSPARFLDLGGYLAKGPGRLRPDTGRLRIHIF